jgi:WD40 repeat protein
MTLPGAPRPPHPYARRHLAAHAAAGDRLDEVLNLGTLPYLDEERLSTLLRLTEPPPLSPQWLLLSAWRSIRHRWSWDDPDANAAALDVAHLAVDAMTPLPERWTASGLTWKPRLAEWRSGGTIVAGDDHDRGGVRIAIGIVRGAPVLVTAGPNWVRTWDPATGQPTGEHIRVPGWIRALTLAEGPGLVLVACDGGRVMAWDVVTHLPSATTEVPEPVPVALAAGDAGGRWVFAAAGGSGLVQVRWIDTGELVREFPGQGQVQAIALAQDGHGWLHLAIGSGGRIAVHDAISGTSCGPAIAVPGEVVDVALAFMAGKLLVGVGTTAGLAGVWDSRSGAAVSSMVAQDGSVSSVALRMIGGSDLLATGSDQRAWLWHALSGTLAGPALPHPARVESVAFGEIEGRTMLVTGCADGNTRLWDPLRSSAARVDVEGWFPSVALAAGVAAAASEDGRVRLWQVSSGAAYGPYPVQPGYESAYVPEVKVRLGGAPTLLALHPGGVGIWDVSNPWSPAFLRHAEIGDVIGSDVHAAAGLLRLATVDRAGQVLVVDLLSGTRLVATRVDGAKSVGFVDAPGQPLLGVVAHGGLHLLDPGSGDRVAAPVPESSPSMAAVGRLDGADVLAVLGAGSLQLYDVETGQQTIAPVETSGFASGIAWGRVGDRDVVVTAHFGTVRVWNPRTGREITELRFGTRIGAMSVQQTDDGRLLVAVSGPGLVVTELRAVSA